jgi:hypothetical protein
VAFAQSTIPPTNPTTIPPATPAAAAPTPAAQPTPQPAAHRAEVVYTDGQLQITADNSSLNQILRDAGRLTGMKITGGVADQRVFGKYGPGSPGSILASLLDGTGSNMLLQQTSSNVLEELILTPQQGGVTPPNPNAPGFDDDALPPPQVRPIYSGQTPPFPAPNSGLRILQPGSNSPAGTESPATPPDPPSTGPQTPQQIYEQLQRLQQAQKKQ